MKKATKSTHPSTSSSAVGSHDLLNQLVIILVGVIILLVNVGYLDRGIIAYWPLLLIVWGLREIMADR